MMTPTNHSLVGRHSRTEHQHEVVVEVAVEVMEEVEVEEVP